MSDILSAINWSAFLSALLGTTIPGFVVSVLLLRVARSFNQSLERIKSDLQQDIIRFTKWHERRVEASVAIYVAFSEYLDFLRGALYLPKTSGTCLDPQHEFRRRIQAQIVFLDDVLAEKVLQDQGELLAFWNDVVGRGKIGSDETQKRLDYEIPAYLPRLRREINKSLDPNYRPLAGDDTSPLLRHIESGKIRPD